VPQRHTDKAPMLSRTSRQRGEQNGGDDGQAFTSKASSPGRGSRSEWCTIRREPPGPPARLKRHIACRDSRTRARSNVGLRSRRPSPPCQRDACSGTKRRTGRRKEPHKYLDRLLLAPRPRQACPHPEGDDPDRRRSLGFLTIGFDLTSLWEREALAGAHLPPCGGESEIEELARSGPNLRFRKRGAR
jgi:hypothetical protein